MDEEKQGNGWALSYMTALAWSPNHVEGGEQLVYIVGAARGRKALAKSLRRMDIQSLSNLCHMCRAVSVHSTSSI